jgi:biotin carboxyl carrier protein
MRRYTLRIGDQDIDLDVVELGADRFEVKVGGEAYDVILAGDEDIPDATITPAIEPGRAAAARSAAVPAGTRTKPAAAPIPEVRLRLPPRTSAGSGGGGALNAPMPGVILDVAVAAGDIVERGQPVATLEAMKMNNVIRAPRAATIAEVCVAAGQAVGHGDPIVRFREA